MRPARQRLLLASALVLAILCAGIYTLSKRQKSEHVAHLVILFSQGKSLECEGYEVHEQSFNFVSGTLSFVGKPNTPYHRLTLALDSCKLKEH